ncbi:putative exocyst complex component Exo70, cullin repeat-like-containing domain superfamily [Helianthus debilis subsp. tardiflorus]
MNNMKTCFSPKRSSSSFIAHYPSPSRFTLPTPSRSLSDSVMMQTLEVAEPVIIKWDPEASTYAKVTSLFYENRVEAFEFIKLVNKLHKAMHSLVAENSNSELLIRAQQLMQIAMKRLEKELSDSVRQDLTEFESFLAKKSVKTTVPGAGVHKHTIDTMNYLSLLGDYGVLSDILYDTPPPENSFMSESFFDSSPAPAVSLKLARFIFILICKLDDTAKHYKDVSQAYLFLANNIQHIVSKVRSSNLRYLLGDEWINKREQEVKKFAVSYERVAWSHVVDAVPKTVTEMTREKARDHFKNINIRFDETHRKQLPFVIPNNKLRDEIKLSIAGKLLPAYREFYNAYRVEMAKDRRFAGVVKYAPEDLGNALSDLFFGSGRGSMSTSGSGSSISSESRTSLSR